MKPAEEVALEFVPAWNSGVMKAAVAAITQARHEGAENMRERAADAFMDFKLPLVTNLDHYPKEVTVSDAIRALPSVAESEASRG